MRISQRAVTRAGPAVVLLLLVVGGVLLTLSEITPAYTDVPAYERAMDAVRQGYFSGAVTNHDAATDAFYAVLDRFETWKWRYADFGLSAISWAVLAAFVLTLLRFTGGRATTRRAGIVLPAVVVALLLMFLGLAAGPVLLYSRDQLPAWSDTIAIPIFSSAIAVTLLAPIVGLFVIPPLFLTRGIPVGLVRSGRGWGATLVVTLIYLVPLAAAAFFLSIAVEAGGWLSSLGVWLLVWLLLNARALWLAPPLSVEARSP